MVAHYDLFAGIGGFSLAIDEVFHEEEIRHIFCEWEEFPTAVLKQHWPDGEYWGDITELVAHTSSERRQQIARGSSGDESSYEGRPKKNDHESSSDDKGTTIVTGGFPCQPFSHAGRRKGTADHRYQWPNMFEVIRNVKPTWVVAENVRGLVTWNDGLVLEQVCTDLESEGYEVQPLIIPAVAVNAPHRRDRVWIIGHSEHAGFDGSKDGESTDKRSDSDAAGQDESIKSTRSDSVREGNADNAAYPRPQRRSEGSRKGIRPESEEPERSHREHPDWQRDWQEVAFATCNDAMDDGLPRLVDGVPYSFAKWRKESLKAYGNGIVHQVAIQIMKAIKES